MYARDGLCVWRGLKVLGERLYVLFLGRKCLVAVKGHTRLGTMSAALAYPRDFGVVVGSSLCA